MVRTVPGSGISLPPQSQMMTKKDLYRGDNMFPVSYEKKPLA